MHNATTKQRLAALRRKLGIFSGAPRWVRERRARLAKLEASLTNALGFGRKASGGAASPTPTPVLAAAMPSIAGSPARADPTSPRSDGTIAPETQGFSRAKTQQVSDSMVLPESQGFSREKTRQVSDSMILPESQGFSREKTQQVSDSMVLPESRGFSQAERQQVPAARFRRTTEASDAPDEARGGSSRRIFAIAAAMMVLAGGLFFALRAPAPAQDAAVAESPGLAVQAAPPVQVAPSVKIAPPVKVAPVVPVQAPVPVRAAPPPVAAAPAAAPEPAAVMVRRGDSLWTLSAAHLGDPLRWPRVHQANRSRIRDPDLIYPGQRLELPAR